MADQGTDLAPSPPVVLEKPRPRWSKQWSEIATVAVFALGLVQWGYTHSLVQNDSARTKAELAPRLSLAPEKALPEGAWIWPSLTVTNRGATSFDLDLSTSMTINGAPFGPITLATFQLLPDETRLVWPRQKIGEAKPDDMRAGSQINLCVRVTATNGFDSVPVVRGYSTGPEGLFAAADGRLGANWIPAHCDP
jgi:hypothetical protein